MLIKSTSDSGHFIHSFYKTSNQKDRKEINNLTKNNPQTKINYVKCTTPKENDIYNKISCLKNLELKSLTTINIDEAKNSLNDNGFILIPTTKQEQNTYYNLVKEIFEYLHPNDLQTIPKSNLKELPQFRIIEIDSSFKVVKQLDDLIKNLTGYKIPSNINSHFQLNTIATSIHVDSNFNFIFSFTTSPESQKMPRTKYIPIKHNKEFEPQYLTNPITKKPVLGYYQVKEDSNLNINSTLQEVPEDNAILFLGDNKFSDDKIQTEWGDKFLHHKAPSEHTPRINMTIRFREQPNK